MNLNELIAEAERLDDSPKVDFARSLALLPLLVKVIKNQQRQIEQLDEAVGDLVDADSQSYRTELVRSLYSLLKSIAAELEDVKPC